MLSQHFTRKGPGRVHCYRGVISKLQSDELDIEREYIIRLRYGAITDTFWRRYIKQRKGLNKKERKARCIKNLISTVTSVMKG